MREYSERLGVPVSWWLVVTGCVVLLGTTLWAGLSPLWAIVIYAVLESASALVLLAWGAARIEVNQTDLRAGAQRLPLANVAEATALDREQTIALRGPRADPAAFLLVRPYLHRSVYVAIEGRPAERPYWLIGTRRPAELAAAIERGRADARGGAKEGGARRPATGAMG
jgi:predicted lysophospholipase L1 biosynthesis ABC-type transport system permease subunit